MPNSSKGFPGLGSVVVIAIADEPMFPTFLSFPPEPRGLCIRTPTMPAMWPPDFEPCHDLTPAEWLRPRLVPWGEMGTPVTSIVPVGYDAYIRVFHPAGNGPLVDAVTWQEVADWSGGTFHALAQFERMSIPVRLVPGSPPFESAPRLGTLISPICDLLVRELTRLTATPSTCYFAIWEGRGILAGGWSRLTATGRHDPDALDTRLAAWQREVVRLPRLEHPDRSYLLGRGPIGVIGDLYNQPLGHDPWPTLGLTPQIWWPKDHAWVVATEIDFDSTIIATTNAGPEALLNREGLEALLVPSDGRLDISGDVINVGDTGLG